MDICHIYASNINFLDELFFDVEKKLYVRYMQQKFNRRSVRLKQSST